MLHSQPVSPAAAGRILLRAGETGAELLHHRRAGDIGRVLAGRPGMAAPRLARMLLPAGGQAQGIACLAACEAAAGLSAPPGTAAARALLVLAEAAVDLVWLSGLHWPALVNRPADGRCLRYARTALQALAEALWAFDDPFDPRVAAGARDAAARPAAALAEAVAAAAIPGAPADPDDAGAWAAWVADDAAILAALARAGRALRLPAVAPDRALPPLGGIASALAADPGFARMPHAAGAPADPWPDAALRPALAPLAAELGAVGGRFLGAAVAARRMATALRTLAPPPVTALSPAARTGVAEAQTLRGPVVCLMQLDAGGRVAVARNATPSDWIQHPAGAMARTLAALPRDGLARAARLVCAAFEPCAAVSIALPSGASA
jgi:hypothetical protein